MKDRWMNNGYEGNELKPFSEPEQDFNDLRRIGQKHTHSQRVQVITKIVAD